MIKRNSNDVVDENCLVDDVTSSTVQLSSTLDALNDMDDDKR